VLLDHLCIIEELELVARGRLKHHDALAASATADALEALAAQATSTQFQVRRTEPNPVLPMSYNGQRLATRRQARVLTSHAPPHLPDTYAC
jgi:hypothetical protein